MSKNISYSLYDDNYLLVKGDKNELSSFMNLLKSKWNEEHKGWLVSNKNKEKIDKIININKRKKKYHREMSESEEDEKDYRKIYVSSSSSEDISSEGYLSSSSEDLFTPLSVSNNKSKSRSRNR